MTNTGEQTHTRLDAASKATGSATYVADLQPPGTVHADVARSPYPHARIVDVDASALEQLSGVIGVYQASDIKAGRYGRLVRDIPPLAEGVVRYVGEPVVAVVAETRSVAQQAAALVNIDYEVLPSVTTPEAAISAEAVLVHDAPWEYEGAAVDPSDEANIQSFVTLGSRHEVEAALEASTHVVDHVYTTPAVHQGYLEPHACVASWIEGRLHVWLACKSPHPLRAQLAACLDIDPGCIVIEPVLVGGDFGGKGSPMEAPLCAELSRLTGAPVKMVLRYSDDLMVTDVRHPARFRVRMGADADGRLTGMAYDVLLDGGAYAGHKPLPHAVIDGVIEPGRYRIPHFYVEARIAYTHTVPKGHMRAPGAPQMVFASESALDELAAEVGLSPVEIRRQNLLRTGDVDPQAEVRDVLGTGPEHWKEFRSIETLDAVLAATEGRSPDGPFGWHRGRGIAVYARATYPFGTLSMRLVPLPEGRVRAEIASVETGTGSHTVVRQVIAEGLGLDNADIEVVQVTTDDIGFDHGAAGSRVTTMATYAAEAAVEAWKQSNGHDPVEVTIDGTPGPTVGSFAIQVADVAVDPETGQILVLEIVTAVDVAEVVNHKAHQMQIDGGVVMGLGYALLENLNEDDGQVWASNLGEYKLPTSGDIPALRTVLVSGGIGHGRANVKAIGELTTPQPAAAIANAVADATGVRLRDLPLNSEFLLTALSKESS